MQLFMERAQAASVNLEVTPEIAREMATICRRLDGVPLALELAAARLRGLSMRDLAARPHSPFALLSGVLTDQRATSHCARRWTGATTSLANRSAVWHVRCPRSTVAGRWKPPKRCVARTPRTVWSDWSMHSLVQFDWRSPDRPYYRMLETVRQFCWEQLVEAGEATAMRDAHLNYYLMFAEAADARLGGPEQMDWLRRLDLERGNLRTALQWAFTRPERELALRLAAALGSFWDIRGERSEGLERLEQALQSSADVDARLRARLSRVAGRLARGSQILLGGRLARTEPRGEQRPIRPGRGAGATWHCLG